MGLCRAINLTRNCWHTRTGRAVSGAQKMPAGSSMAWQLLRAEEGVILHEGSGAACQGRPGAGVGCRVLAAGEGGLGGVGRGDKGKGP